MHVFCFCPTVLAVSVELRSASMLTPGEKQRRDRNMNNFFLGTLLKKWSFDAELRVSDGVVSKQLLMLTLASSNNRKIHTAPLGGANMSIFHFLISRLSSIPAYRDNLLLRFGWRSGGVEELGDWTGTTIPAFTVVMKRSFYPTCSWFTVQTWRHDRWHIDHIDPWGHQSVSQTLHWSAARLKLNLSHERSQGKILRHRESMKRQNVGRCTLLYFSTVVHSSTSEVL